MRRLIAAGLATLALLPVLSACGPDLPGNGSEDGWPGIVEPNDRVYIIEITTTKNRKPSSRLAAVTVVARRHVVRQGEPREIDKGYAGENTPTPFTWRIALAEDFHEPIAITVTASIHGELTEGLQCVIRKDGGAARIDAEGALVTDTYGVRAASVQCHANV